jgi:hypothetical protein
MTHSVIQSFSHSVIQSFSHSVIQCGTTWSGLVLVLTGVPDRTSDLRLNIRHSSSCIIFAVCDGRWEVWRSSSSLITHYSSLITHSHTHSHAIKHTSYFRTVHQNILQNIHLDARTPEHHQSTRSNEQNSSRTTTEKSEQFPSAAPTPSLPHLPLLSHTHLPDSLFTPPDITTQATIRFTLCGHILHCLTIHLQPEYLLVRYGSSHSRDVTVGPEPRPNTE